MQSKFIENKALFDRIYEHICRGYLIGWQLYQETLSNKDLIHRRILFNSMHSIHEDMGQYFVDFSSPTFITLIKRLNKLQGASLDQKLMFKFILEQPEEVRNCIQSLFALPLLNAKLFQPAGGYLSHNQIILKITTKVKNNNDSSSSDNEDDDDGNGQDQMTKGQPQQND